MMKLCILFLVNFGEAMDVDLMDDVEEPHKLEFRSEDINNMANGGVFYKDDDADLESSGSSVVLRKLKSFENIRDGLYADNKLPSVIDPNSLLPKIRVKRKLPEGYPIKRDVESSIVDFDLGFEEDPASGLR